MAAQRLDDLDALAHIDLEVRSTRDEVHLVEIVGPHAHPQQPVHQRFHDFGIIVYALEQHALVAQRHSGKRQPFAGILELLGRLLRVIEVHAHPNGAVFLENLAKLRRDALGQEHRDARADADELHVLDRAQPAQQMLELLVRKQQRVAPGKEHVTHLGVCLDVAQRLLVFRMEIVVLRVGNQPAAGAIPAVGGAAVRHQEKHPVRIAVHETRHRRMLVLTE